MAPVAKSNREQGQISIFFSASLVVLISIIAFVINVGLFVKAKINLQNATDAAAFAGASVQSRQLSKIAYLNWEMRNIYKEWMYKYYVIGNLNIVDVGAPLSASGPAISFRLADDRNAITGVRVADPYNFPSVCIHLAGSLTNICKNYSIPGLPEFGSSNLPGAEEASRAFMDSLIGTKINDCIDRTRLNMLVATTWAYNVFSNSSIDETLVGQGPAILANRQGAWPRAVELAMRMRNLELAVNRPPFSEGVCMQRGGKTNCGKMITDVSNEPMLGNERMVKAFYSGYRNLGNEDDSEMKDSFTLTEIPPKRAILDPNSASYLLTPPSAFQSNPKNYLDLKLMMVNYAVFYDAMIPRADSATSGACDVSKVAIPVPGYPLGFYKNPDVVTYYAVRGEAEFVGMFNPFGGESVKLTAYASAKPFGGRIGPMLFSQKGSQAYFTGRNEPQTKRRSVPYITTLDLSSLTKRDGSTLPLGQFIPGAPLPINFSTNPPGYFWLKDENSPLGGTSNNGDVQFGIPNMVYDYEELYKDTGYTNSVLKINSIKPSVNKDNDKAIGLFSKNQFNAFKGAAFTGAITQEVLESEIDRIRAATLYESANYLIPSPEALNESSKVDSFGFIQKTNRKVSPTNGTEVYTTDVFAPLYSGPQSDVYWHTSSEVVTSIFDFMRKQESAVTKYRMALNQGAKAIYDMRNNVASESRGSIGGYERAAAGVSDINFTSGATDVTTQMPGSCASLAGQFLHFYYGDPDLNKDQVTDKTACPKPLGTMLREYFSQTSISPTNDFSASHYRFKYSYQPRNFAKSNHNPKTNALFSAYVPGPFTGVAQDGTFTNAVSGSNITESMRRNFYSTKFVALDALRGGRGFHEASSNFAIMSEGAVTQNMSFDTAQAQFLNTLDSDAVGIDLRDVKY